MKKQVKYLSALLAFTLLACNPADKDDILPVIEMQGTDAFPTDCAILQRGTSFTFRATLRDNEELGSYSIEMHHNFDHHTHSTSSVDCPLDAIKTAVHPFHYLEEFTLPAGLTAYKAELQIAFPDSIDPGDYHFMIRVTDRTGWQALKGISLKIVQ